VRQAVGEGVVYALSNQREIRVAEKLVAMCPALEMVRFANSGTEATMHALRLARAYTNREKVIKFEGQYHGMYDYMLFSTYAPPATFLSRYSPVPVAASSGIPKSIHELVITLPFNDFELLERTLRHTWFDVAAIIIEPIMGNCASIEPLPGWLEFVRSKCTEYGIVMIMDEVKTGFRVAPGGAQELYGVEPDLATYAKAMGNGYPVAAFGGKRAIMSLIGRGVAHGGTYTSNVIGMAAAEAVLDILEDGEVLDTIAQRGRLLQEGLKSIFQDAGIPLLLTGHPAMFGVNITDKPLTDSRAWAKTDHALYERIMGACVKRGVMPDIDPREPWFLCYSHSEEDINETLNVVEEAVREVKS
jgi:glutamate-1-semialdehyde 2,1-aminomutase